MKSTRRQGFVRQAISLLFCILAVPAWGGASDHGQGVAAPAHALYAQGPGFWEQRPARMPGGNFQMRRPGTLVTPPKVKTDHFDLDKVRSSEGSPFGVDDPFIARGNPFTWNGEEGASLIRDLDVAWVMPSATFGISPMTLGAAGRTDFTRLDRYVLNTQALNLHLLFVISPREPSSAPPPSPPQYPKDMDAYLKLVRAAVERYDGDGQQDMPGLRYPVKYWMVLNEPFFRRYWGGSAEEYCSLFIQTYGAIKKADPSANVVLSSLINPHMKDTFSFAERFFACYKKQMGKNLAPQRIEAIDLHWISKKEADRAFEDYRQGLDWLRDQHQKIGLRIPEVICTEACILTRDREEVAHDIVKRYLLARSMGIAKIFWSSLVSADPRRDLFTGISLKTVPNDPALAVYKFMVKTVGAKSCSLEMPKPGTFEIMIHKGPKVWWQDAATKDLLKVTNRNCRDIYGKGLTNSSIKVGQSPVYCFD